MTRAPRTDVEALARALQQRAAVLAAAAQETVELGFGSARRTPDLPLEPELNTLCVARPDEVTADGLLAAAGRLGSRQVELADAGAAARLLPDLEAAGAEVHRLAVMVHAGAIPAPAEDVERCDPGELAPLRAEWLQADPYVGQRPELVRQILEADRRIARRTPTRGLCVRRHGRPLAMGLVIGDGPAGMVEDVYVTPAARGRGLGTAIVGAALSALAGAELAFLVCDADGRARALYERLGFRPVGVLTRFSAP